MMETFGRSNLPKCDAVYWRQQVSESCPKCSAAFVVEKTTKKDGTLSIAKTRHVIIK